jgi:hypothetical protein
MYRYYAELSTSDFKTLLTLKQLIEIHSQHSTIYEESLFKYRDFLGEITIDLSDPLPSELEINQELLPQEYIDFKADYSINGPYTLKKQFGNYQIVYLIEVISVSRKNYGSKTFVKILKSYKNLNNDTSFLFISSSSQGPKFKKLEVAIVFLYNGETGNHDKYPEYWSHNSKNKMEILQRGDSKIAISPVVDSSFWNGLNIINKENHVETEFTALDLYLQLISKEV